MLELYWHQAHIQTPKLHFHRKTKASALPTPSSHPDTKASFLQTTLAWWRPLCDHPPPPSPPPHNLLNAVSTNALRAGFFPSPQGSFILCTSLFFSAAVILCSIHSFSAWFFHSLRKPLILCCVPWFSAAVCSSLPDFFILCSPKMAVLFSCSVHSGANL